MTRRPGTLEVWFNRILVVGLSAMLLTVAAYFIVLYDPPEAFPAPPPGYMEHEQRVRAFEARTRTLIREGKWVEAKTQLQKLQAEQPGNSFAADFLPVVEREITNQEHLAAAQSALAAKTLAVAKAQLDQVSTPIAGTDEQVNQLKRQLRETADAQVSEARRLISQDQRDEPQAILADVLAAFPEHREALALSAGLRPPVIADPPPPEHLHGPWAKVLDRFMDGDLSGAMTLAQACAPQVPKCGVGARNILAFSKLSRRLMDLDAKGLARMVTLDKEITGPRGPSHLGRNAGIRASNLLYQSALAANARGQWPRAVEASTRALELNPGHTGATQILAELRAKAKDAYLIAYKLKDTHPEQALPQFRQAVAMTAPDDELHQKALAWIERDLLKRAASP